MSETNETTTGRPANSFKSDIEFQCARKNSRVNSSQKTLQSETCCTTANNKRYARHSMIAFCLSLIGFCSALILVSNGFRIGPNPGEWLALVGSAAVFGLAGFTKSIHSIVTARRRKDKVSDWALAALFLSMIPVLLSTIIVSMFLYWLFAFRG